MRAILVVDGVTVFSRDLGGTDTVGFTETVPIDVVVSSTVDLLLHPIGFDSTDTTTMWMTVESR